MPPVHQPSTKNFWKHFRPASCSVALKSTEKEEALAEIVANMVRGGTLDAGLEKSALRALIEREELASTGVGMSVAIPHVKLEGLPSVAACLSVQHEGLDWAAVDGEPVHILFSVLRPAQSGENHDPDVHLEMMRWIARLGREGDFRRFALQATNRTELVDLLKEMSQV